MVFSKGHSSSGRPMPPWRERIAEAGESRRPGSLQRSDDVARGDGMATAAVRRIVQPHDDTGRSGGLARFDLADDLVRALLRVLHELPAFGPYFLPE